MLVLATFAATNARAGPASCVALAVALETAGLQAVAALGH
jgi:hypothetical protein